MPTAVENIPRTQIATLENGLKSLRHSKLINSRELKDMYDAIEKHHREIRLAHLTGKPKDIVEQAKRDTKFFFILVKLLSETLNGTHHEQQDSLREVYSWYIGNKHTLANAPKFGKQKQKKKTKSATPSSRPVSGLSKLGHVTEVASKALEKEYGEELRELMGPPTCAADLHMLHQQHKAHSPDTSHRQSTLSLSAMRSEMETPDSSATKRLSEPHQHLLPKRQNKPLAHLYNPHSRDYAAARNSGTTLDLDTNAPVRLTIHTYDAKDTGRSSWSSDMKSSHMRKWDAFQEQISYGQNELNKLQHCGRTGVAGGQRYVAHEHGLAAEQFTQNVIATVASAAQQKQETPEDKESSPPAMPLERQSLEDFYQNTQGYYPAKLPKYPSFRLKSAPSTIRQVAPNAPLVTSPLRLKSSSLVISTNEKDNEGDDKRKTEAVEVQEDLGLNLSTVMSERSESPDSHEMRLDTVVTMIDSVTDEMTFFKEKLVPEPIPGFRKPVVEVNPEERPQTAPSLGAFARPSTPLDEMDERPGTALSALSAPPVGALDLRPGEGPHLPELRPGSGSARGSQYDAADSRSVRSARSFTTEEWHNWRERFLRENSRYKWQATPAGGHAYYRKAPARPGSRSAGRGPSGSRPKTAPQTPRERWNTAAPNEENARAVQAATHTSTEVEQDVMDTMFAVRRLGGKNARHRRYRFFMDYRPDSREFSRSAMTTPAMEYVSFIAPKPVAGSRASSAVTRSRLDSAMDGHFSPYPPGENDNEFDEENQDDEDDVDSMGGDLDLPAMDDLDDDLDDNFQYEGDAPLGENDEPGFEDGALGATDAAPAHEAFGAEAPLSTTTISQPTITSQPTSTAPTTDHELDSTGAASDDKMSLGNDDNDANEGSEQDFDSVCIRSSTQESELDVERECEQSRQLIEEIETLVTNKSRERRPVSSHSRVTFQEDPIGRDENQEPKEPLSEQGRKVLKPKSILVPRHIQPPPSVGLTIVQFQRGGPGDGGAERGVATQRASHKPTSAPTPGRGKLSQVLSQSEHWSCDPHDLESTDYEQFVNTQYKLDTHSVTKLSPNTPNNSARLSLKDFDVGVVQTQQSTQPKPRFYTRSFPKQYLEPPAELDVGLTVEGRSGVRAKSARVGALLSSRSAGVSPLRSRSASHLKMLQKQQTMLKNAPAMANRSAPSIPSVQDGQTRLPSQGPFSAEHDSHARKEHSPRRYMEKVGVLRKSEWVPNTAKQGRDGYLTTTLRVARMQPATRNVTSPSDQTPIGHPGTPVSLFSDPDRISERSEEWEDPLAMPTSSIAPVSGRSGPRIYVYSGRPIPHYASIKTPEESQAADQLQKEAAAAVNIQKNFRGYVARKNYDYLLREERHKREDRRVAAIKVQKAYRAHRWRTSQIYSRTPVKEETLEWAREFKRIQEESAWERNAKAGAVAMQNSMNKAKADAKLSIIGPHVEVYTPFHPRKTGAKKEVLNAAATCLQRHLKGWLIRKKFADLKRKALQHASSWGRFVQQYRDLIRRVQVRHGISRPKIPFSFKQVSEFMDLKKRYESGFESHAFAGELELDELHEYFRECDLYPVQADIDEAFDIVFRGQVIKKGLQKHQVMDLTFQLYPPAATGITNSRRSTWTNPIINGEEGNKIIGTEFIEPTDFGTAWKLVSGSVRERKEEERAKVAKLEEESVRAKLEAIKAKPRRKSSVMEALQEEEEKSTASSDRTETTDTGRQRDKRVTFTDTLQDQAP